MVLVMKSNTIVVTGGRQRERTLGVKEWSTFDKAVMLKIDLDTEEVVQKFEYCSPADCVPDTSHPSILFKSGSILGNRVFVCTQTEVLEMALDTFQVTRRISKPYFNDVHHVVCTTRDTYIITVTGLDLVVEMEQNGKIINEWSTCDTDTWSRFSRKTDYRKILTTKPHLSHPNYVFQIDDEIWVTRFEQKDAICLSEPGKSIYIGIERPHDGVIYNDKIYFTTVDGHVVVVDIRNHEVSDVIQLEKYNKRHKLLGWCRGLSVLEEDLLLVGFSRIRPTKIHSNLLWFKGKMSNNAYIESESTRIGLFDLKRQEMIKEIDLEKFGLNAIFSILNL